MLFTARNSHTTSTSCCLHGILVYISTTYDICRNTMRERESVWEVVEDYQWKNSDWKNVAQLTSNKEIVKSSPLSLGQGNLPIWNFDANPSHREMISVEAWFKKLLRMWREMSKIRGKNFEVVFSSFILIRHDSNKKKNSSAPRNQ